MTLKDVVMQYDLRDLIVIAYNNHVDMSDIIPDENWLVLARYAAKNDQDSFDYYIELAVEGKRMFPDVEDEIENEEDRSRFLEDKKKDAILQDTICAADGSFDQLASRIADSLLDRGRFEKLVMNNGSGIVRLLEKLFEIRRNMESGNDTYTLEMPYPESYGAKVLNQSGYAQLIITPAWKSSDNRRHVIGITITGEVLDLFKEVYTPEKDRERRIGELIRDCCYVARDYYGIVPLEVMTKLYNRVRAIEPDSDALTVEEMAKVAEKFSDDLYTVFEYEGKNYIAEQVFADEVVEDPESSFFLSVLRERETMNNDFYYPDIDEFRDYSENGYWLGREGYRRLKEWMTIYYMDEMHMANMFPNMLASIDENAAEYYNRDRYCMDDVDRDVSEIICWITTSFRYNNDVEDVLEEEALKSICLDVTDEAKEELIDILKLCYLQTNVSCLLGHIRETENP